MATDTESMHENMTRLRMRMVQQKLANEREKLQSASSENGYDDQIKLRQAMLKRQELLDKIRNEQLDDKRPRTYTPRRRYTPSPLPPPSRRSLPDLNKQYHFINARNPGTQPVEVHILHSPGEFPGSTKAASNKSHHHHHHHYHQPNHRDNRKRGGWITSPKNSVIVEARRMEAESIFEEDELNLDPSSYQPAHQSYANRQYQNGSYHQRRLPSRVMSVHEFPVHEGVQYQYQYPSYQTRGNSPQTGRVPSDFPEIPYHINPPYRRVRPRAVIKHPRSPRRTRSADMAQVKHVIEHQFRSAPQQQSYQLPPIQTAAMPQITAAMPQITAAVPPVVPATPAIMPVPAIQPIQAYSAMPTIPYHMGGEKGTFNKGDMMEMMMMQNAQMHHMVMQQMMLSHLPGGGVGGGFRQGYNMPYNDAPPVSLVRQAPSVYHHHINSNPPDYRRGFTNARGPSRIRRPQRAGKPNRAPAVAAQPGQAVVRTDNVKKPSEYPFPGPRGLRKLRHIAYAAWFISILKNEAAKKKRLARPSSVFLFGIILKEIVAALHRIYLNPNGNIYPVLMDVIGPGTPDLTTLMTYRPAARDQRNINRNDRDDPRPQMLQSLQYVVENLVYHMTEIMPKTGVLGTHRKSAVFELIKNGKRFPDGYFWQIELDRMDFDGSGRTVNVGNLEAFVLIVGIFLSRSFITTLLLKPVDYGISTEALTETAEHNIRVIASCLLFIVRRVSTKRDTPMLPMPGEVARYVFSDEEMKPVHLRLKKTYEYCENLLREWGAEYIKRLRQASNAPNTLTNSNAKT